MLDHKKNKPILQLDPEEKKNTFQADGRLTYRAAPLNCFSQGTTNLFKLTSALLRLSSFFRENG